MRAARELRRDLSLPEVLLWQALRQRPSGFKFRRQHPCGRYVIDFACLESRLAIEVDGEAHNRGDRPERDHERDSALRAAGFEVVRIAAVEVRRDATAIAEAIGAHCAAVVPLHHASHGPPPRSGEDLS